MKNVDHIERLAAKIRRWVIEEVYSAKSGHPGGSLSCADFLACVYESYLRIDSNNPEMIDRDRLVLSKGHCAPALYAVLALKGYFPLEDLKTFRNIGSKLQGHPSMKHVPGVDMSTGSLGQGFSAAVGMALASRAEKYDNWIYAILGDGELQEGQVWEAAMCAAHYGLNRLIAFVDLNGLQIDGDTKEVMNVGDVAKKFKAFDWNVLSCDGNDVHELTMALGTIHRTKTDKPTVIVGHTIKGKGVSFMEGQYQWHGSTPNPEQYETAVFELDARIKELERCHE
jgi:transketolase subunit A (EC 2.2.1.1)